jgi:hypothetical protein
MDKNKNVRGIFKGLLDVKLEIVGDFASKRVQLIVIRADRSIHEKVFKHRVYFDKGYRLDGYHRDFINIANDGNSPCLQVANAFILSSKSRLLLTISKSSDYENYYKAMKEALTILGAKILNLNINTKKKILLNGVEYGKDNN